jgi:hypothetical protein
MRGEGEEGRGGEVPFEPRSWVNGVDGKAIIVAKVSSSYHYCRCVVNSRSEILNLDLIFNIKSPRLKFKGGGRKFSIHTSSLSFGKDLIIRLSQGVT